MRLVLCILICLTTGRDAVAQHFQLTSVHDSLFLLTLKTDLQTDTLELPYRVYRFCTADLDGDGKDEAIVGVVKSTRFFADPDRRIFLLKNYDGQIRTLWRGSRIGRRLVDFQANGGIIRCLMQMNGDRYSVADYSLSRFGLRFERYVVEETSEDEGRKVLHDDF